jgi:hypothetical protein
MRRVAIVCLFCPLALGCSTGDSQLFTSGAGGGGHGSASNGTGGNGSGASGAGGGGASGPGSGGMSTSASTASGSSAGGGGVGGGSGTGTASTGSGGGGGGCIAGTDLVYVFAQEGGIFTFNPPTKVFNHLANPQCTGGTPNSMAIDRQLIAWLNYIGGIYTFDLKNPQNGCQKFMNLAGQWQQIGMGFSTDVSGGTAETLYVDSIGGGGLGKVDMVNKVIIPIGTFSNDSNLQGQSCELTGTGDASLYGYFTTFPNVRVAQIDKTTSNIISDNVLMGVSPPSDWAFSFWGGDFYLYAAPGTNQTGNSSVIHYTPSTGAVDPTYVADVGFHIIGAGVSTCAPLSTN